MAVIWISSCNNDAIDQVFCQFFRCILQVKATTSNVMVIGEYVQHPPNAFSHINALSYMGRLQTLPVHMIAKRIYTELFRLHDCGWNTLVTEVFALSERYGISFNDIGTRNFQLDCKRDRRQVNAWANVCLWTNERRTKEELRCILDIRNCIVNVVCICAQVSMCSLVVTFTDLSKTASRLVDSESLA